MQGGGRALVPRSRAEAALPREVCVTSRNRASRSRRADPSLRGCSEEGPWLWGRADSQVVASAQVVIENECGGDEGSRCLAAPRPGW